MPKAGVYLVYDNSYQVIGVASGDRASWTKFGDENITVVGPVELDKPIDWEATKEERYGIDFGPVSEFADMKDGVPLEPLTSYEEYGIQPSRAKCKGDKHVTPHVGCILR